MLVERRQCQRFPQKLSEAEALTVPNQPVPDRLVRPCSPAAPVAASVTTRVAQRADHPQHGQAIARTKRIALQHRRDEMKWRRQVSRLERDRFVVPIDVGHAETRLEMDVVFNADGS